jgi:iron complex transport system substrate-binding protein
MKFTRRNIIQSGAAIAASTSFPAFASDYPRTIIDATGLHTVLEKPVERVVIATHYSYEDFTAIAGIDGWKKVVGFAREPWEDWRADDYAEYSKVIPNLASIPDVGALSVDFDANKVIALKPDIVLLDAFSDVLIGDQTRAIRAANIPIVFFDFQSENLDRYSASTIAIGRTMGADQRVKELTTLYEKLYVDVMNRVSATEPYTRSVYAELAEEAPEIVGWTDSDRLWAGMAIRLGAKNIAQGLVPDYGGQLPTEALLKADPDMIFFAGASWPSYRTGVRLGYKVDDQTTQKTLSAYMARPGYEKLKAVKAGKIYALAHNLSWSLRDVYAMQFMAKQLYPEQFADIDPVAGLKDFHDRFLLVPFSGTWFASFN